MSKIPCCIKAVIRRACFRILLRCRPHHPVQELCPAYIVGKDGNLPALCCHSVPTFDSNNPLGAVFISALRNMAYHRKLVLPAFKVTRRSTAGDILEKDVPRGFKNRDEPVYSEDTAELNSEEEGLSLCRFQFRVVDDRVLSRSGIV